MLIDTHCHLGFPDFQSDMPDILHRAREAGVERIIVIGTNLEQSRTAIALADQYDFLYATVGIHPCDASHAAPEDLREIEALLSHPKVVAIGECGLDHHRLQERNPGKQIDQIKKIQIECFEKQLDLACETGLNVVVHQRDCWDETLSVLRPYQGKLKAVFHCFGGTPEQAAQILDQGHILSFTGIVTFKNAQTAHQTAACIGDDTFMIETDAPFLAPAPHRGKRCEPAHVSLTAHRLAELRKTSYEQILHLTSQTALHFFRWPS